MFIPYKDDNPGILIPFFTWAIIVINILIFLYQSMLTEIEMREFILTYSAIPARISGEISFATFLPEILTLLTSVFLHGGFIHLLSNMLFLYIFADNIESILGHRKFLFFYLLCGGIATFTQTLFNLSSTTPILGASGAIAGIMAGYILKYPSARIHVLVFIFPIKLPASIVIGFWFLTQIINSMVNLNQVGGGIAWFSHIGGFIAGIIIMFIISKGKFYWIKQ